MVTEINSELPKPRNVIFVITAFRYQPAGYPMGAYSSKPGPRAAPGEAHSHEDVSAHR